MKFSDLELPDTGNRTHVDMTSVWGDGANVYVREPTPADHSRVGRDPKCKGWPTVTGLDGAVMLLTLICQTEDGGPFFDNKVTARKTLMGRPMSELTMLLDAIGSVTIEDGDVEAAEGN